MEEEMIMDTATGKPIPVSQYLSRHPKNRPAQPGSQHPVPQNRVYLPGQLPSPRPYKCPKCNRTYSSLGILNHHMRSHETKKTLSCTKCHLLFATYDKLESHFHRVHKTNKRGLSEGEESNKIIKTETFHPAEESAVIIETEDEDDEDEPVIEEEPVKAGKEAIKTRSGRFTKAPLNYNM